MLLNYSVICNHRLHLTSPRKQHPTQNGPGIAHGAVSGSQQINAQAVTPFAFSTYSSIWLKFRDL
jgi:hypothetical protein